MGNELAKRLTGMSRKEIIEHAWPAVTLGTQFIPPRGFSTPADVKARREELRNRPTPKALQPPSEPG